MTTIRLMVGTGALALLLLAAGNPVGAAQDSGGEGFTATARAAREGWLQMPRLARTGDPAAILEARARLETVNRPGMPGNAVIRHLIARFSVLAGRKDEATEQLLGQLSVAMAAEGVFGLRELHAQTYRASLPYSECLVDLVPLSGSRSQIGPKYGLYSDINPPRAFVPGGYKQTALGLGECLADAGLSDLAWRAYAEGVYAMYSVPWVTQNQRRSWLCPEAAEYWAKAAQCARRAGRQELAWDYLMKAAVFGDDAMFDRMMKTAREWAEEPGPPAPLAVDPAVKREALTKAVRLYAERNAHPRAFTLIDEYPDAFEDPEALRKEIEQGWLAVVKDVSREAGTVTLYGYEVYPDGDPLKVRIPWALSDEALASAREYLAAVVAAGQAAEGPQEE